MIKGFFGLFVMVFFVNICEIKSTLVFGICINYFLKKKIIITSSAHVNVCGATVLLGRHNMNYLELKFIIIIIILQ